jgi:hypothetical protein
MSYVRLNITDQNRTTSGDVHGYVCDAFVAALTAEPETIEELELALGRFISRDDWSPLAGFFEGENLEPYDAGIVVINLAARLVAIDSTYSYPSGKGSFRVQTPGNAKGEDVTVPVEISDDWLFVSSIPEYEDSVRARTRARSMSEPLDSRAVLYGKPLLGFIAQECTDARNSNPSASASSIHSKWLMTPREELGGQTPRNVLLERHELIDSDLHSRSLQHSFTNKCPPALPLDSKAYRFAGFGRQELVVYYDLVRFLLHLSLERVGLHGSIEAEVELLENLKSRWLNRPNADYDGRTPAHIIESERRRVNITMSAKECIIDEDCPICLAMAEDLDNPTFWSLDGSSLDESFEFSFFRTPEEYDAEERMRDELMEDFERRREELRNF